MELDEVGRLILALTCIAILIGARWYHERQLMRAPRLTFRSAPSPNRRPARRTLPAYLSQSLYWLGLTTSAALAAQAIAAIIGRAVF
ncbi:MAG: hypothetical protein HY332_14590 [Chloroflexi bacterium]|nr:hypothetical protein [Chloroflexota bacterium]